MNLKKIVFEEVGKRISYLGYSYDKEKSGAGVHWFTKKINGFDVGIEINKSRWGNLLFVCVKASNFSNNQYLYYVTQGIRKEFEYKDEAELRECLRSITDEFVSKGDKWIEDNSLKEFNAPRIYEEIVDKFFKKHSYVRSYTDNNIINGGKVIYKNSNIQDDEIVFIHSKGYATFWCKIINNYKEIDILRLFISRYKDTNPDWLPMVYENEQEYIESIKKYLDYFENEYFNRDEEKYQ